MCLSFWTSRSCSHQSTSCVVHFGVAIHWEGCTEWGYGVYEYWVSGLNDLTNWYWGRCRFVNVTDRFLGELSPVILGQVPKDLDMKHEKGNVDAAPPARIHLFAYISGMASWGIRRSCGIHVVTVEIVRAGTLSSSSILLLRRCLFNTCIWLARWGLDFQIINLMYLDQNHSVETLSPSRKTWCLLDDRE